MIEPQRILVKVPVTVSVADNTKAVIVQATNAETLNYDVYLSALGVDISPISNQDFATFRLRVNGVAFYPFDAMTSQIAPSYDPRRFEFPLPLGRSVSVDVYGEMGATGAGPTNMTAGFELLLVPPGQRPQSMR